MKPASIRLLRRAEVLVAWRKLSDVSLEAVERAAQDVFPLPLQQLHWTTLISRPLEDGFGVLFMAVPHLRAESGTDDGQCVRFIAAWQWARNTRPDLIDKIGAVVALIDQTDVDVELTVLQSGFPIFSRACEADCDAEGELDKILRYLRATQKIVADNADVIRVPPGVTESFMTTATRPDIPWLVKPKETRSKLQQLYSGHRNNVFSLLAVLLVLGSVSMQRGADAARVRLAEMTRESRSLSRATNRNTPAIPAGQALNAFVEAARRAPAMSHLLSFHYDGAGRSIAVEGRAADYALVSDYVTSLEKQKMFSDVQSERTRLEQMDGRSAVNFSLKGTLR